MPTPPCDLIATANLILADSPDRSVGLRQTTIDQLESDLAAIGYPADFEFLPNEADPTRRRYFLAPDRYRADGYAAKFLAETVLSEPATWVAPTDDTLRECFLGCAIPAPTRLYPMIRERIAANLADLIRSAR